MNNSSIDEYSTYFKVTDLKSSTHDTIDNLFYSIFKRFIITNFIALIKTYTQLVYEREYFLSWGGTKYFSIEDNFLYIVENKSSYINYFDDSLKTNVKFNFFIEKLKTEIAEKLGIDILECIGDKIINRIFYYKNKEDEDKNKVIYKNLFKILYFLLDYKEFLGFDDFDNEIHKYIFSLYNSKLFKSPTSDNVKEHILLYDLIGTYTESLRLYCNDLNYFETTECNTYYVEFNDKNKINNTTHQLLSMFVFLPDNKSTTINIISKHFFIIKDIVNHILYQLKIKKDKIIGYSSIIMHSFCAYHFNESFFLTNPKPNMESIFVKYIKKNNTVKILDDYTRLVSDDNTDKNVRSFIDELNFLKIDTEILFTKLNNLRTVCRFTHSSTYHGHMLFNVINFREDWIKLIKEYITKQSEIQNVTKGGTRSNKYKKTSKTKLKTNIIKIKNTKKMKNKRKL